MRLFAPTPPPTAPAAPPGTFNATAEQWATLRFALARRIDFAATQEADGKIAANDERTTQVFSPYSGHVTRIFVQAGDPVRPGSPLFAVNASEFIQGEADLATASAQVKLARAAEARQRALFMADGTAQKDLQQSEADLAAAQAALAAARNRLRVLGQSEAQIHALESRSPQAGVQAEAVVPSPIAGIVTQRSISVGQNIASLAAGGSGTAAMTVSDLSRVWLIGNLRAADAPKARLGQVALARVDAFPDRIFRGTVSFVSPVVDPATRRVAVRAEIANPDGALKPEMFATFTLVTGADEEVLAVPEMAVISDGDAARVWIAGPGRSLALRAVRVGRTQNGMVEILSGLTAGERVVTSGSLFIDRAAQGD